MIGLGNPGEKYAGTYHNAGWEILDFLKTKLGEKYDGGGAKGGKGFHFYQYGETILAYPDIFMNRSGEAVRSALAWFKKQPEDVVVFHDDSDLAVGEWREATGGAAGHHGIESILESMSGSGILRVRIGIRDPREKKGEHPRRKAGEFVLKKISKEDREKLESVFQELAERFMGR